MCRLNQALLSWPRVLPLATRAPSSGFESSRGRNGQRGDYIQTAANVADEIPREIDVFDSRSLCRESSAMLSPAEVERRKKKKRHCGSQILFQIIRLPFWLRIEQMHSPRSVLCERQSTVKPCTDSPTLCGRSSSPGRDRSSAA